MQDHQALQLISRHGTFRVAPVAPPVPAPGQIVVRARAVAINPIDRFVQPLGGLVCRWLRYPAVPGYDVAGEVAAVGAGAAAGFRVGDRVVGLASGTDKGHGPAEGAFQTHVVLAAAMAARIPDALAFEQAAVLPLGLCTAASGLFQKDYLALRPPSPADPVAAGETLLVWGASTSVGSNAVQLAVAAGYDVVATASPHNHAYVAALGARAVFDYRSPAAVTAIAAALRGRRVAGALAIGAGSTAACIGVLGRCEGRRFVAVASPPVTLDAVATAGGGWHRLLPALARIAAASAVLAVRARRHRITTKFIWGSSCKDNEVGPMIFGAFLPQALAAGTFGAMPPARVAGHGLEAILPAFAELARGVSARKIVVTL